MVCSNCGNSAFQDEMVNGKKVSMCIHCHIPAPGQGIAATEAASANGGTSTSAVPAAGLTDAQRKAMEQAKARAATGGIPTPPPAPGVIPAPAPTTTTSKPIKKK